MAADAKLIADARNLADILGPVGLWLAGAGTHHGKVFVGAEAAETIRALIKAIEK